MVSVVAIALAGGQSSRMGRDKALLPVQWVPLLRRVCEVALQCVSVVYVVTPQPERYRAIVPEGCHWIQERSLPGETEPHGPLVGFAQGLAQVEADWVLLLACDLPRLQVEVLQGWIAGLDTDEEAIAFDSTKPIAYLPRTAKGWDPLCGFYRRTCLPSLTAFIDQGGRSFQHWLAEERVQELIVPDYGMLFNCNTPADLATVDQTQPSEPLEYQG